MPEVVHVVRDGALYSEKRFKLTEDCLSVETSGNTKLIPHSEIQGVTLSTYQGVGGRHGQAVVLTRSQGRVTLRSHHYDSDEDFVDRSASYEPLVRSLLKRVASANPEARFRSGNTLLRVFWLTLLLLLVTLAGVLALALAGGGDALVLLAGIAVCALCAPVAWSGYTLSKTADIDPHSPPHGLLRPSTEN